MMRMNAWMRILNLPTWINYIKTLSQEYINVQRW
jgi:hypothetical protein